MPPWALARHRPVTFRAQSGIIRSTTVAPMVFKHDASNNDKDQPRATLKRRVQAALMPRRHIQSSTVIISSTPESECNTLVDFPIGNTLITEDDKEDVEADEYVLDPDNCAWTTGRYASTKASKKYGCAQVQCGYTYDLSQDELLDTDNSAWATALPQAPPICQPKSRTWFPSSGRRPQATSGIEPQMLDPEDRAWM
ncbi:hypothetical protein C8Q78DRAFT_1076851 [Trametes maxima]|nr:hypothetical protein C8Q78DRAFT_1076851 [Trametes maxima]